MAKVGRPTKLTPEVADRIVAAVAAGNYLETAAAFAGISKATLYKWLTRGARASSGTHRAFVDAIEKALAQAEVRDVSTIARAATGYDVERIKETITPTGQVLRETARSREFVWQAAAWRLERKHPDRWGRRVEVSGAVEQRHLHAGAVLVVGGTTEEFVAALRRARNGEQPALPARAVGGDG